MLSACHTEDFLLPISLINHDFIVNFSLEKNKLLKPSLISCTFRLERPFETGWHSGW